MVITAFVIFSDFCNFEECFFLQIFLGYFTSKMAWDGLNGSRFISLLTVVTVVTVVTIVTVDHRVKIHLIYLLLYCISDLFLMLAYGVMHKH
ncbi:hypothetical protein UPYG_G00272170 [Umbra pygmaea]|uniref:Uncharacterized protein n=1 Tax=Umbra pygmaea TaxID=75934 RepID=A0ABD0WB07_UMBPY